MYFYLWCEYNNADKIIEKATKLYNKYKNNKLRQDVYKRCCDFAKLEKFAQLYNPKINIKSIKN